MSFPYLNQGDAVSRARPDAVAFLEPEAPRAADRRWTFGEFDAAADRVARQVLADGHRPGDRVALLGRNSTRWLVAFYGLQRAGLVPVPVSWKLPADGVRYVLADSGAVAVLADDAHHGLVADTGVPVRRIEDAGARGAGDGAGDGRFPPHRPRPEDPAMFLYTSGSTGRPKGVVLSHRSHLWVLEVRAGQPYPPGTRSLVAAPLYHMNALANCQTALVTGATTVLLPAFDARTYARAIADHGVHRLTAVPPMIAMLLQERELTDRLDLSGVTDIFMGSAPASQALFDRVGSTFPGARVQLGYGTTESGPVAFTAHPDGLPTPVGSVGVADPHVELRLVGPDGRPAATEGVLEIRCPALMNGYHNRPDVPDPLTEDGFYHTKDIFRVDEHGFHFFVGRSDDMFVSGGENIYPGEVERLIETHPDVLHAAVVPVPDEVKGTKPVAFVVARAGSPRDAGDVQRHVLDRAPAYLHPRRVWFVDELPLSATNKIDRTALAQRADGAEGARTEGTPS